MTIKNYSGGTLIIFTIVIIFIILISFSVLLRFYLPYGNDSETKEVNVYDNCEKLKMDGVITLQDFISKDDIKKMKGFIEKNETIKVKKFITQSPEIKKKILKILGNDYIFHDYIFLIRKSQFHTCHRDYNGDFFNPGQQYPSYTIIIYLEDMAKCLDVIKQSHQNVGDFNVNLTDYTQSLLCKNGDAILFNANIIHNGSLNENENNMRIQMKISHKKDMNILDFYNNYNKTLNSENNTPFAIKNIQKHLSCQFPIISYYLKQYDNNKTDKDMDMANGSSIFSPLFAKLENIPT